MNENEFREQLGSEIGEEPPIVAGPAAVFAGARRQVLRTRALTGTLSMAAVLGVAAGAVALSGGSGGSGGVTRQAGSVTTSTASGTPSGSADTPNSASGTTLGSGPTSAATSTSEPGPLHFVPAPSAGPGQVLLDGRSTAELLKGLLPAGAKTSNYAVQDSYRPVELGVMTHGAMSVVDASGRSATIWADVQQSPGPSVGDMTCAKLQLDTIITDCQETPQANGTRVLVFRQHGVPSSKGGEAPGGYANAAWLVYPDGMRIAIMSANYTVDAKVGKNFTPTADAPLWSLDQLKVAVLDPRWKLTVSAEFAQQARRDIAPAQDFTQKN